MALKNRVPTAAAAFCLIFLSTDISAQDNGEEIKKITIIGAHGAFSARSPGCSKTAARQDSPVISGGSRAYKNYGATRV